MNTDEVPPHLFSGIKVLDISKVLSGPYAARLLADHGAEVIKIESATHPDDSRSFPPLIDSWSGYYEQYNHNKKGRLLELAKESDYQQFIALVKQSDVLIENLTTKTTQKLKIDYDILKVYNPRLIYASIDGDGTTRKYYDVIAQAESGMMSLSGLPGNPIKIGPATVDAMAGVSLAYGIAGALYWRTQTNRGQHIHVSLLSAALQLTEANLIDYSVTKNVPNPPGNHDTAIAPFGLFSTQDGYVVIACGNDHLWNTLSDWLTSFTVVDHNLFSSNSNRIQNQTQLTKIIEAGTSQLSTQSVFKQLSQLGIPCAPVRSVQDIVDNPTPAHLQSLLRAENICFPANPISSSTCDTVGYSPAPKLL